jgi:hypothetical protein
MLVASVLKPAQAGNAGYVFLLMPGGLALAMAQTLAPARTIAASTLNLSDTTVRVMWRLRPTQH